MKFKGCNVNILLIIAFIISVLSGCEKKEQITTNNLRVGVVLYTTNDAYIDALSECIKNEFQKYETDTFSITVSIRNGQDNQSEQNNVVEEIIDAGCDILLVNLVDRNSPSKIIKMAKENNIPIIFFNREPVKEDIMQWDKLYYVGANAGESGILQAEIAVDLLKNTNKFDKNNDGKIQYTVIEGEAGHQDTILRTDKSVETLIQNNIKLDKISYQFADWNRQQAEYKMTQLIEQNENNIELIISNNDQMALGVIDAYEKAGYSVDEFPIILGIDGLNDALNSIKDGKLQGTVYNDKDYQSRLMVILTLDLYYGNKLTNYDFVNGRFLYSSYKKIDINNVDEYIK